MSGYGLPVAHSNVSVRRPRLSPSVWQSRGWRAGIALMILILVAAVPTAVQAQETIKVWRSSQFGMKLDYPAGWSVVEQRTDPVRGDVVILGNETSAVLIGLLHDTRSPSEMADDLVLAQKAATPDLAVVQQNVTETGSVLMFLQYTIHPHTDTAMLIDEKALVGNLQPGVSTITVRGMVPDRVDVEAEFEQIETMIGTLAPDR
ncbi:MAG: hypothetical protein AB7K36_31480 [Chloroflexota bacterium]